MTEKERLNGLYKRYKEMQQTGYIEIIAWDSRKLESIHLGTADIDAFEEIRSLLDNN